MEIMGTYRSRLSSGYSDRPKIHLGWKRPAEISTREAESFPEGKRAVLPAPSASRQKRIAYGALLLFVALIYLTPGTLYPPLENLPIAKAVAVISFLFLFFAMRARGQAWRFTDPPSLWLIAFAAVCGFSIVTALWSVLALSAFLDFLKVVLVYFLMIHLLDRLDQIRTFFWVMLWGGAILALGTLTHYVLKINLSGDYRASWIGIYEDPNDLAYNLVVLLPIGLALLEAERVRIKKIFISGLLVVFLAAIYVTYSRGAWVGVMAIIFFQILRSENRVRHFSLAAILFIAVLAAAPAHFWERVETILNFRQDPSAMGRIYAWNVGFSIVRDRPLLGVGIGCFVFGWPIYAPPEAGTLWRAPHNTFVAVMGEEGLLGLAAFCIFIGAALRRIQKVSRPARPASPPLIRRVSPAGIAASADASSTTEMNEEARRASLYARGVEVALWGFLTCSLTLGVQYSWPPYLFAGLAVAICTMRTGNRTAQGE